MTSIGQIAITGFVSLLACVLLIAVFGKVAPLVGLVDRPNFRKKHVGEVPIVGGVSVYLAVLLATMSVGFSIQTLLLLGTGFLLISVGLLDDRFGLSAYLRFPVQVLASVLMVYLAEIHIETVGNIFGNNGIRLAATASVVFTVLCSVGVINSINMIDGVDGLSGTIVSLTLLPLIYLCWIAGDFESVSLLVSFFCATQTFLYFNARIFRRSAAIFLGDAGSMFFGFLIVWFLVKLSQGPQAVLSPISAGWIFGLPLVDTVAVMVHRILEKRSPFDADRNHLHHKLLDAGFSVNQVVIMIGSAHAVFICVGLFGNTVQEFEPVFFWLFVSIVLIYFWKSEHLINFVQRISKKSLVRAQW